MGNSKKGLSKRIRLGGKLLWGSKKQLARRTLPKHVAASTSQDTGLDHWEDVPDDDDMDIDAFLGGDELPSISHAGGEFAEALGNEMRRERGMRKDNRDRRDRILRRTLAFQQLLPGMVDAYLQWTLLEGNLEYKDRQGEDVHHGDDAGDGYTIKVVDAFRSYPQIIHVPLGQDVAIALVNEGLIPCSPSRPSVAITVRTLELFRVASLRCPRLAVQNVAKTLCDLHRVPYKPHLSKQYTICQDLYISILEQVESRVQQKLKRDSPRWRLEHACPACTYSLENENKLRFKMLFTMDGNDSLKRVLRRMPLFDYRETETGDILQIRVSNELPDERHIKDDYYVDRARVARWTNNVEVPQLNITRDSRDDDSPCSDRWKNMSDQHTSKAWGMFDETGIFVALCRHGFVLLFTDMVQSGEGSQYPLAILEILLDCFGSNLGGGYDIGCRFKTTITRSQLGPRAQELSYTSLVGAFHGHAHNRICQLSHLTTYVEGLGLSDLEGAERLFSKSNDLASSVRHSSVFHRQQRIINYFKHLDSTDTYETLSNVFTSSYATALEILATAPDFESRVHALGIAEGQSLSDHFKAWLEEEKKYLLSLSKEPLHETLELDYYRRLVSLNKISSDLNKLKETFHIEIPSGSATTTASPEASRRRLEKSYLKTLEFVANLEAELGIEETWQEGDANWVRVAEMFNTQNYRRCLDKLEQLVVSRMFELGKMNRSGSGYKLRQHIAKALKTRSQAIRQALQRYNDAARRLRPPRETLQWDQVIEFAFLSEFDILAETREDVRRHPWAQPAARTLMDQYFKIERAKEEIIRLNIEIPRLTTYMRDEEDFLRSMEYQLQNRDPAISRQISLRRRRFELVNQQHRSRLQKLSTNVGFTASLSPGIATSHIAGELKELVNSHKETGSVVPEELDRDAAEALEEEEEEDQEVELGKDIEMVMRLVESDSGQDTNNDDFDGMD